MAEEEEVFDLGTVNEYDLLYNEDGTVLIQDNCVVARHNESLVMKFLPLTDEVLQAFGLALVLDDQDTTKPALKDEEAENEINDKNILLSVEQNEVSQEDIQEQFMDQVATETAVHTIQAEDIQSVSQLQPSDGTITIVFTDDEDAELAEMATTANRKTNRQSGIVQDKELLIWTTQMVNYLLDLYEKYQHRFVQKGQPPIIWRAIYNELCQKFPELKNWSEINVQNKFTGLKRTYRGAVEYLKDNLHTTKWPFFERMHKIMNSQIELEYNTTCTSVTRVPAPAPKNTGPLVWQRQWTPILLDAYYSLSRAGKRDMNWLELRQRALRRAPALAAVTHKQIQQKFFNLRKMYKAYKSTYRAERKGELKDPVVFEKMDKIHNREETNSGQNESTICEITGARINQFPITGNWPKHYTNLFLDLYTLHKTRISQGMPLALVYEDIADKMKSRLGEGCGVTAAACADKAEILRSKMEQLAAVCTDGAYASIQWPFFQKAAKAFDGPSESWTKNNINLLLNLYEDVQKTVNTTNPRFWGNVAKRFKESIPTSEVTGAKCEAKFQSLLKKYHEITNDGSPEAHKWPYYEKVHSLVQSSAPDWSPGAVQILLTLYQQRMSLDKDLDQLGWQTIADNLKKLSPDEENVTAESCRQKILQLKEKYCSLLSNESAAKTWPLFKRISEIFSSHLWSKRNVSLLLDCYEAESGPELNWGNVARRYAAVSTGAASADQCRTEISVLKTRYNQLLNTPNASKIWTFYDRMHEIFGKETVKVVVNHSKDSDKKYFINITLSPTYTWTSTQIHNLLDTYIKNRELFNVLPQDQVWQRIDDSLEALDDGYKPGTAGYGARDQYLDLVNKYMEMKERGDEDWEYFERMDEIFNQSHGKSSNDETLHSTNDIRELLADFTTKRKRGYSQGDSSNVFVPEPTSKRKRKESWNDEEEIVQLIDVFKKHNDRFISEEDHQHIWNDILSEVKSLLPKFERSQSECEEKLHELRTAHDKMSRYGTKLSNSQRISNALYEKMKELLQTQNNESETLTNGDSDILQTIAMELKRQNELNEEKLAALNKLREEKKKQHQERLEILKKIQDCLLESSTEDKSDVFQMLEKTLEEIHK